MSHQRDESRALLEAWEILLRYRWRFIVPAFVVTSIVLGASLMLPRKYKAEAQFDRRTDMVLTEITIKGATRSFQDPSATLIEQLTGEPAVDALFEALGPELEGRGLVRNSADRQALRSEITRRLIVTWDINTGAHDRVRLSYTAHDPQLATMVVNTLVENHIARTRAQMDARLNESAAFFQAEVDRHRKVIEGVEARMLDHEITHSELLPGSPNSLQTRIEERQARLDELAAEAEAARLRAEALELAIAKEPEKSLAQIKGPNPEHQRLGKKRRELSDQITHSMAVLKMTEVHPDLVAQRQQLERLDAQIAEVSETIVVETREIENERRADLALQKTTSETRAIALAKQVEELGASIEAMRSQSDGVFAARAAYRKLEREAGEARRQVAFWEDNLRRVEMARAAETGQKGVTLDFIRPAAASSRPISPDLAQVLMAAVAMGLFAGGLGVFFAHRGNEAFHSGQQAARSLDLPLFGSVSEIITRRHRRIRRMRRLIVVPTQMAIMAALMGGLAALVYLDLEKPDTMNDLKAAATDAVEKRSLAEVTEVFQP